MLEFERCAWCSDFLEGQEYSNNGICVTCVGELGQIPDLTYNIDREFVDNLPFGNIVLDPNDIVVRYNAIEASQTGYDSKKIEGKHFFKEVAPCTQREDFLGILERRRENKENHQDLFKFNFRNPNFNALVSILMTYYRNGYVVLSIRKIKDN